MSVVYGPGALQEKLESMIFEGSSSHGLGGTKSTTVNLKIFVVKIFFVVDGGYEN